VTLNLLDNIFLLHFALETAQRILEGLTLLNSNFRQLTTPPNWSRLDRIVIARFARQVKWYVRFLCRENGLLRTLRHFSRLKNHFQSQLHLPRSIGAGGTEKVARNPVLSWEAIDSNAFTRLDE